MHCGANSGPARSFSISRGRKPIVPLWSRDEIELVVQVNGKLRGSIRVASDAGARCDRAPRTGKRSGREVHCREEGEKSVSWYRADWSISLSKMRHFERSGFVMKKYCSRILLRGAHSCGFQLRGQAHFALRDAFYLVSGWPSNWH